MKDSLTKKEAADVLKTSFVKDANRTLKKKEWHLSYSAIKVKVFMTKMEEMLKVFLSEISNATFDSGLDGLFIFFVGSMWVSTQIEENCQTNHNVSKVCYCISN